MPLPSVRKRTTVMKKLSNNETDIFQDADEDFIPSESEEDDDDDDDENYLPEHDRRPYHRSSHINGNVGRGLNRNIVLRENPCSYCFSNEYRRTWPRRTSSCQC